MNPSFVGQQLAGQAPMILIYVVSIIFCLVFIARNPLPAVMALVALVIGLVTLVGYVIAHAYLLELHQDQGWDQATFARALATLGMAATGARALALALLVAAVFVGRKQPVTKSD